MICFDVDGARFQLRAAAVVVCDGRLLLHRAAGDPFWSLPGGRVEAGEPGERAVLRELREEIGVADAVVERTLGVVENFFEHAGLRWHEVGFVFAVASPELARRARAADGFEGIEGHVRLEFRWFECAALASLEIYPRCIPSLIGGAAGTLQHHVEHESAGNAA
jgi:ADP-ribose pyrophosphatase YjhB (NUDIX family)